MTKTTCEQCKTIQDVGGGRCLVCGHRIGESVDGFDDYARACNLYLMDCRYLGTDLGGRSLASILETKTKWDRAKCDRMASRILLDEGIAGLIENERLPKAFAELPPPIEDQLDAEIEAGSCEKD